MKYSAIRLNRCTNEQVATLTVTVLFMNAESTLTVLQGADNLAAHLNAQIQILIPYVVPYPLPIDKAQVDPRFRLSTFLSRLACQPVPVRVDIRLCRNYEQGILDGLPVPSLIVIAGRRSNWPFTREKILARRLTKAGHQVVVIPNSPPSDKQATM